jgi:hypothetical protein
MIKKIVFSAVLFAAFLFVSRTAKAGDLYAGSSGGPDIYTVEYATYNPVAITTTAVLVSLSSQTAAGGNIWPHPLTARAIVIDSVQNEIDKAAATTAGVKIGVVREINISSGTIVWFDTCNSTVNVSNTNPFQNIQYGNGGLNTRVNPVSVSGGPNIGTTPWIFSNDLTSASPIYISSPTVGYPSTASQSAIYRLQVGDIVQQIATSGAANIATQIRYHVENQ